MKKSEFIPHPKCQWGYDPETDEVVTTNDGIQIAIPEGWQLTDGTCPRCKKRQTIISQVHSHCVGTHDGTCDYKIMGG